METNFGDPSLSSTQLRQKAFSIISDSDRPMASCEIEQWIRNNDYELWSKVSGKCKDYVRVILSQTRGKTIVKYKATKQIGGIDKRSTFYGIYGRKYPSDTWVLTQEGEQKKAKKDDDDAYEEQTPSYYTVHRSVPVQETYMQNSSNVRISPLPVRVSPKPASPKNKVVLPPIQPLVANFPVFSTLNLEHTLPDFDPLNLLV